MPQYTIAQHIMLHNTTSYYEILQHQNIRVFHGLLQHTTVQHIMLHHSTAYYRILGHAMAYCSILKTAHHATSQYSILRNDRACHGLPHHTTAHHIMLHHTTAYYGMLVLAIRIEEYHQSKRVNCKYIKKAILYLCDNNKNHTVFKRYFHFGCDNYEDHTEN